MTQTDVTDPRGHVRRVTFNADRFMTSDTRAHGTALAQTTTYTRLSGSNLVETETDALGRVTRYTYVSSGNVTSATSLDGTVDAVTTSYTYDATYHLPLTVTDPLNHTTTVSYDGQGRIQATTDALSHRTTFGTNQAGQVVTVTTPLNKTTTLGYAFGDLVSIQTPLGPCRVSVLRCGRPAVAGGSTRRARRRSASPGPSQRSSYSLSGFRWAPARRCLAAPDEGVTSPLEPLTAPFDLF